MMPDPGDDSAPVVSPPNLDADPELLTVTAKPAPPDAIVLSARGDVDLLTSSLLKDRLLAHLSDTVPRMIVDLNEVGFFGAAGLTVLATVNEAAVAAGVKLCVVARTRVVLLPLTITGLDSMFQISPDLTHALFGTAGGSDR
jgi:anti-sigma B factor antagonist